jgi:signal transduction histidine kinase/HPt (histidine-containing phosphotransfer) domain-containing protein
VSAVEPACGNILLVDDEPLNLKALEALLADARCHVVTAASGREALRAILRMDFALILLDVRMPDMDGFETAALIRKLQRSRHTPIVFLTAADDRGEWQLRGYEVGAVDYLVKPVDPEVLKSKVAIFVDLENRNASLATQVLQERAAQRELLKSRDDLEIKVRERTAKLISAHDQLREEIQQRERAEAELRIAKRAAEEANRAKSEFLASMSHEVRTPIGAIIGLTQVALDTELTPEQRECLELIRASGDALLAIVNDALDVSKIEAGRLTPESIPFQLRECIDTALKPLAVVAAGKSLELNWVVAADVPETLRGDPLRLRQILLNLVSNAIKFTERGGVTLGVTAESVSAAEACCHFTVRDTGIGIPCEQQAAVFAPFRQADADTARRYGGTGLGLTISARMVELLGGRIWLESAPHAGSTFHFTLRFGVAQGAVDVPQAARVAAFAARAAGATANPLRLLLVEDNAVNRRLAEIVLRRRGHTVMTADNGFDAVAACRTAAFDFVLMDVEMPGMDGLAATRAIRELERSRGGHSHTPILALTAHAMPGVREQCLAAGMDGYLAKPIEPAALLAAVEERGPEAAETCFAEATEPEGEALLDTVGDDPQLLEEICALFARESNSQMVAARDAIERGDAPRLNRAAHTLRGMLQSVRGTAAADRLAAALQSIDPGAQRGQALAAWERLQQAIADVGARLAPMDCELRPPPDELPVSSALTGN